jgi:hypothetical protein
MPIKLSVPLIKDFTLEKCDKAAENTGEPTRVTIRQAAQGERERRDEVFSEFKREYTDGKITVTQRISYDDVVRTEVFLTMAACNIQDMNSEPLFKFKGDRIASEEDFLKAWAQLPPSWADEIHEQVLKVNLLWSETGK